MGCSIQLSHDTQSRKHENEEFNELFDEELIQQLDERICNIQINKSVLVQRMLYERQHYCSCPTFGIVDSQEDRAYSKLNSEKKKSDSILKSKSKERQKSDRSIKKVTFAKECLKNKKKKVQKTNLKRSSKKQITINDLDLEFN